MMTLEAAYARCEQVMKDKAKSFYFAMSMLPKEKLQGVYALYHFCRTVDDLTDDPGDRSVSEIRMELGRLADLVKGMAAGHAPDSMAWMPLFETIQRFEIPSEPLLELIEGVSLDLEPVKLLDTPSLLHYSYLVAGVVGLMLGPIYGAKGNGFKEGAISLGIAMQLTNILRDVGEDLQRGRIYLPASELAQFGLSEADLHRGEVTPAWRAFMAFQIDRARRYYHEGKACLPYFPNDGARLAARAAGTVYGGILDAIERCDYDVFSERATVGTAGKLMLFMKALLGGFRDPKIGTEVASVVRLEREGVPHGHR